ncbi:LamG domain-containing protein [Actinoplanes couchii]|uniref:LamG-like jellyroll fold domain-containing protein n=1 Tax=Actinoplanes couchii TaxID=403638 RepID=A0ABQ3X8D1_9ACTN|nr:LamG domain-containing protein [Actinoplanes couchii]MDR6320210.1 hypothetical protein [Actinoplanes couchii]GID54775.1 hypothetical protein Aco03nite_031790 [Actinoplanes couchii]
MTALDRGLAVHLPLTASGGDVVVDVSGNGNDVTLAGAATPAADDLLGGCLALGAGGGVVLPALGDADEFTILMWVRLDTLTGDRPLVSGAGPGLALNGGVPRIVGGGSFTGALRAGAWQHLAIGLHGRTATVTLVVDGGPEQTLPSSGTPGALPAPTRLGATGPADWRGRIGGLRIYRRALGTEEIRQLRQIDLAVLAVHLPLTELTDGTTPDIAGTLAPAVAGGTVESHLDDVFGACLRFDGDSGTLTGSALPALTAYTVSLWVRPESGATTWQGIAGSTSRAFQVWLHPDGSVRHRFPGAVGLTFPDTPPGSVRAGSWRHVTVTNDGATATTYVDGVLSATGPAGAVPAVAQAPLLISADLGDSAGGRFRGSLAHLRIHRAALPAGELRRLIDGDRAAILAFRRGHPLGFRLTSADEPVLPIDDDPVGHQLFAEISNTADEPVTLSAITGPPTAAAHHLALRFRAGALAATCLDPAYPQRLVRVAADRWRMSDPVMETGSVVFYLASTVDRTLGKGGVWHLTLEHAVADAAGGARATRVELSYRGLFYAGQDTPLEGTRSQRLSIVDRLGRPDIPLHVGFTGGSTVLNDGDTESVLLLHVANLSATDDVPLAPSGGSAAPTRLRISFDHAPGNAGPSRPWALGTADDLKDVDVPDHPGWKLERSPGLAEATELVLTPLSATVLGPRELMQIPLARIRSSLPTGPANITVEYENVPGYQDGRFVCQVQKGPLTTAGPRVGIGTAGPAAALHLRERIGTPHGPNTGTVLIDHENAGGVSSVVFRSAVNRGGDYGYLQYQDSATPGAAGESARLLIGTSNDYNDHVILQPQSGNVGIRTADPKGTLHVAGDYYGKGKVTLHANEGDRGNGTAILQAGDDSGTSAVDLALRAQSAGQPIEVARIGANGRMTVGAVTTPNARFTVQESSAISAYDTSAGFGSEYVTVMFHGRIGSGGTRDHYLFVLPDHATAHVESTVLMHDVNSNTNRYVARAVCMVYRQWVEPPVVELVADGSYSKSSGVANLYGARVMNSGNDILVRVSQGTHATTSVYRVVVRYLKAKG